LSAETHRTQSLCVRRRKGQRKSKRREGKREGRKQGRKGKREGRRERRRKRAEWSQGGRCRRFELWLARKSGTCGKGLTARRKRRRAGGRAGREDLWGGGGEGEEPRGCRELTQHGRGGARAESDGHAFSSCAQLGCSSSQRGSCPHSLPRVAGGAGRPKMARNSRMSATPCLGGQISPLQAHQ